MASRNRRSLSPSPQTVKLSINSVLCASLLLLLVTVPGISCFSNEKPSSSDSSSSPQTPSPVKSDGDGSVESAQRGGTARSRAQGQKADTRKEGGYLSLGRKQTPVRRSNICSNRSCTTQENINCQVTKRSQYCMHRDESALDHPNSPRDLKIQQKRVGNYTYFNVTWQAPYDYSYRAVKGYELMVTTFGAMRETNCFFVNLSSTNWTVVKNIHDVVFFMDCWRVLTAWYSKAHVKIFSYPKLKDKHDEKSVEAEIYPIAKPALPKLDWYPNISTAQYSPTKSLVVTVSPRINSIHYLTVCISLSVQCEGNVTPMESPNDTFRYSVTGLHVNTSYYVYVKPLNKNGDALDKWIHTGSAIKIEPWPEVPDPPKEADHVDDSGVTEVLVALLLVILIAVVTIVFLWKKGYLHKVKFLRCCLPQSSLVGQPIKVLQMYVVENEPFRQVVQKHMAFLQKYLNVEPKDANEMRHLQNQDQWLENTCSESRVIVYISPQLMHMLRNNEGQGQCGEEVAHPHPLARKYAQMIHRLTSADALKKGRGKGRNPVFILSGCFPSDTENEKYVNQQINMRTLQRHWISKHSVLTSPAPLLSKLSGCHHSFFSTRDWASCDQARELSAVASHMYNLTHHNHYYVDLTQVEPNNPMQDEVDSDQTEHEHHYSSVEFGDRPRRTDSGFSSSTMDANRCSNHSSEGNSSLGVTGGDECTELDSHAETYPMLQNTPLSVSQIISFTPPELDEAGERDSRVLDLEFLRVNSAGESRWSPRSNF